MTPITCPAVLVSAPASGQGKTLSTAALARAWKNRGLNVRAFKCGPDFLDPMVLEKATGQPVYNLDLGMCGEQDGLVRLYSAAQTADVIIVEGVMGLYDGTPSSADIAVRFGLPVIVTIDASGMAQTFGAIASGLLAYQPKLTPAGVLANKVGSISHANMLRESLPAHLSWFGALQRDEAMALPERHLGLFRANEIDDLEARIEYAAIALANSGELPLPPQVTFNAPLASTTPALLAGKTIAIARDEAFCFIYPANLDCLGELGATVKFFSPLHDKTLPEADAYWLPGGYPELHLKQINENSTMRASLHEAFNANKPILAECGGMMALSESINGASTFGLLTGNCQIEARFQGLGTQHVSLPKGEISAHTFHYGSFTTALAVAFQAEAKRGKGEAVYQHGSITASFLHFYFASNPQATASLFLP
ncbi:MAG: cobyrinate a,c-diamide synthase [Methylotenera sp.]|nr:cobyrinate a,c-diamide synthase [Methylotenera sp.]MDP1755275.1 cobyrinate a,c-diamide synthase [Methylotenera sp.]MDP1960232.1 cobyrinate a,c-diamide synthase [Methylotenera sp.]MDP3206388.1 cobyrinate a,c-diamide synthase [Methylotenera sp.]MDP3303950.1 cobyrinate a,c-diamide synthase [Methylotenera sp.]